MTDIDSLMQRIGEINSRPVLDLTPKDIDDIVAYHRRERARRIAGVKPTKTSVDISGIMSAILPKPKPASTVKRRF